MSSEHDLLFSQSDSVMFPEFANLSEFEDLGKGLLATDAIDVITEGGLMEELDSKEYSKPLLIPGFHAFSTALVDAKAVEKPELHIPKAHDNLATSFMDGSPQSQSIAFISTNSSAVVGLPASNSLIDGSLEYISAISGPVSCGQGQQVEISSPITAIATKKMNCMSLKDGELVGLNSEDALAVAPPLSSFSPLRQGAISSTGQASPAERMILINPSAPHNVSPISSPSSTISTSDGSCAGVKGPTLAIFNGSPNRMLAQEDNFDIRKFTNSSLGQLADTGPVSDCSGVFGRQSPRADASGNVRGPIPPHVMQEASHLHSMQRSYSSHSLGQFRTPSHAGACHEELSLSPAAEHPAAEQETLIPGLSNLDNLETNIPGLSNLGPYPHYQISDSLGLSARSPIASMRRVCSTGDLQFCYGGNNLSPLEHFNMEEVGGSKIGHYTSEERKMKLDRYRQKRTERNFNKKIKYACRKTLADSRPRIRGRFARTDDVDEPILELNGAHPGEVYEEGDGLLVLNDKCIISNTTGTRCWSIVGTKAAM